MNNGKFKSHCAELLVCPSYVCQSVILYRKQQIRWRLINRTLKRVIILWIAFFDFVEKMLYSYLYYRQYFCYLSQKLRKK